MAGFGGRAIALAAMVVLAWAPGALASGGPQVIRADTDGDKVFDDLTKELAGDPASPRVGAIVVLNAPATAQKVGALQAAVGSFAVTRRFTLVKGFAATLTKAQVAALAARSDVVHVEENTRGGPENAAEQRSFGLSKARIDVPGLTGAGMTAAVLDTGIDQTHRDLDEGKVIAAVNCTTPPTCTPMPSGADNDDSYVYDHGVRTDEVEGHGTHTAAILAGDGDALADRSQKGVAPDATLVDVKVLPSDRALVTQDDVVAGLEWVVANRSTYGIDVVSMALGFPGCNAGTDAASLAVDAAAATGLLIVVAAGNDGPNTCTVKSPGSAAGAFTVGNMADSSGSDLGFRPSHYLSGRGPTLDGRIKPDIMGPGVSVTSAYAGTSDGYVTYSGTSMATPFVAGVALLIMQQSPSLTSAQVRSLITSTAEDWGRGGDTRTPGTTGPDIDYGAGRIDAYAALKAAGAPLGSPPAVPAHLHFEGNLPATGAVADFPVAVQDLAFPFAATLIVPGEGYGSTDINLSLQVLDPSNAVVASSALVERQNDVGFQPAVAGTYTLRVTADVAAVPADFFVDVSAGTGPADTTPPTIVVSDRTVAATSASGAPVLYTATSPDNDGTPVACAPASGTTFPIGATLVTCTTEDAHGNQGGASFTVTVVDRPPVLSLPADITRQATGPAGAVVTYTATASNGTPVACSPASGSTFPLGATTVTCRSAGASPVSGTFRVAVVDTRGPALTLPGTIAVPAASAAGAVVSYTVSATDLVGGSRPVTCVPPSGASFPAGTTTVACTARDAAGNASSGSFQVRVTAVPVDPLVRLRQLLAALPPKARKDLENKLDGFLRELAKSKQKQSCKKLADLVKKAGHDARKWMSAGELAALTAAADAVAERLDC